MKGNNFLNYLNFQEQQTDLFKNTAAVCIWGNSKWKQRPREEQAEADGTEELEQVARIDAGDFKDLLNYVNGDVAVMMKLPDYRNKQVVIVGNLDLSGNQEIKNLDLISKVEGKLNISNTSVDIFDDEKADGVYDYNSLRYRIKKQKELDKKYNELNVLRANNEWDIQNGDEISLETEALYEYIKDTEDLVSEDEDKYFLYPLKY